MPQRSAGLLIYRRRDEKLEVLIVHPGGPYWQGKDEAAWSIPKGLVEDGEDELAAARREVQEELGVLIDGNFEFLGNYKQSGGKVVVAWSVEADVTFDIDATVSNTFEIEWPPRSGKMQQFPEVDRAEWFSLDDANRKIHKGQQPLLTDFAATAAEK
jgi:predicted NUDIX family NTP pyrophosphohydrolase